MPGIFGFSGISPAKATASIEAMGNAMTLYPHFVRDPSFISNGTAGSRVHLGKIGMQTSPFSDVLGNQVWVEGEAYNHSAVCERLGWDLAQESCDSFEVSLLYAYRLDQLDSFLKELDGYFCAAIYDPLKQKIILVSDRYGMRMLYWYHRNELFAWSSEVKGLLALKEVDRTIDPTTLPCFMDLGYLLGEHTWFEHIHLIKPATIVEFDIKPDVARQHYYWTWAEIKPSDLTFDDAVDSLYEAFLESVRRRFNPSERMGISLSGGLDSRAIFAAVNHLYPDYEGYAYTFGIPECDDIRIAKEVVSRSNWRHEEFHFNSDNWYEPRKQMIWHTDGMLDMMHMHGGEFLSRVSQQMDINLNGYLGDVVAGGGWMVSYAQGVRADPKVLSSFYKTYGHLAGLSEPYLDGLNAEPGLYMSRARRFTNMGTVNGLVGLEQRKPFFDNAVLECLLALPPEFRAANCIYSEMLQRHFPKFFKDIPWQKTGKPASRLSRSNRSFILRAINKSLRISKSMLGLKSKKNYTDYASWLRNPALSEELSQLLQPAGAQYKQLTSENWADAYLLPHLRSQRIDRSNQVLRAATVELYLRKALLHGVGESIC
jgi:asparagine synthase (glutamine-hydrolysing)